jgi:RNA polymerase sigma-70 factor (sigma-E family)
VAQPGWETEFTAYVQARTGPLRRLAYGLCGDWHLAEDLVQTTFVRLYRHWGRARRDSLDPYTRRILVNAFLNHRRQRRREAVVADVPDSPAPAVAVADIVDIGRVLAELPPRQRALVVLRYLDDVAVAEAAELLGISEGTVKSQTARAVQKLRTALGVAAGETRE